MKSNNVNEWGDWRMRQAFDLMYVDRAWPRLHRSTWAAFVAWLRCAP